MRLWPVVHTIRYAMLRVIVATASCAIEQIHPGHWDAATTRLDPMVSAWASMKFATVRQERKETVALGRYAIRLIQRGRKDVAITHLELMVSAWASMEFVPVHLERKEIAALEQFVIKLIRRGRKDDVIMEHRRRRPAQHAQLLDYQRTNDHCWWISFPPRKRQTISTMINVSALITYVMDNRELKEIAVLEQNATDLICWQDKDYAAMNHRYRTMVDAITSIFAQI